MTFSWQCKIKRWLKGCTALWIYGRLLVIVPNTNWVLLLADIAYSGKRLVNRCMASCKRLLNYKIGASLRHGVLIYGQLTKRKRHVARCPPLSWRVAYREFYTDLERGHGLFKRGVQPKHGVQNEKCGIEDWRMWSEKRLILRKKIIKIVAIIYQILRLKCTKIKIRLRFCPRPRWGAYSAFPNPLAGFNGAYS